MTFWSLANASHALATGFGMLMASRFLLGMGEGGGFPTATRAVAEWFPAKERASAMGIINAGTAVGAVIAPPLIAIVLDLFELALDFCGHRRSGASLGVVVDQVILFCRRIIPCSAWSNASNFPPLLSVSTHKTRWSDLLRIRESWGLVSAKFLSDAAWYFYLFWLPKYLYDARGFDVKAVGTYAWIPYAAAGIGCLLGGWFSSYSGTSVSSRWAWPESWPWG